MWSGQGGTECTLQVRDLESEIIVTHFRMDGDWEKRNIEGFFS